MAGGVLALDLATRLGWAFGAPGRRAQCGVVHLVGREPGAVFAACVDAVADLLDLHQPSRIVAEAPLPVQAQTHGRTAEHQFGLHAVLLLLAYRRSLPASLVRADVARRSVLGRARFGGRSEAKEAVMAWCRGNGFDPADDNAADAMVLLHHALGAPP
ncbi:hypothetical protein GXW74_19885 [Roseomonas eburnea]|uniref:Uncharacterized protein n=1 Tax=Neoroseomonas eburnea TaxID=1346889 RepID=A0A9X9XGC7_9PROT|nr:hypothetical protein [Neoroseomonas eburnea]MBR0682763.1 hypothetical protein [Neoroseomonas eburnea]